MPTSKEIAIVWHNTDQPDDPPMNPDFVCYPGRGNTKELKRLNLNSPFVEPFSFVLFNPYGGRGWSDNLKLLETEEDKKKKEMRKKKKEEENRRTGESSVEVKSHERLTLRSYYLYKLALR